MIRNYVEALYQFVECEKTTGIQIYVILGDPRYFETQQNSNLLSNKLLFSTNLLVPLRKMVRTIFSFNEYRTSFSTLTYATVAILNDFYFP